MKPRELFESLLPEFFDNDAIRVPPEITYRIDNAGERLYARPVGEGDELKVVPSVTTILRRLPTPPHLIKWHTQFESYDDARAYVDKRADYGTYLHILFKELLQGSTLQFDIPWIIDGFTNYLKGVGKTADGHDLNQVARDIRQDLFAFVKWCKDFEVKPLAIEYIVFGETYAGALDLLCEITVPETIKLETYQDEGMFAFIPGPRSVTGKRRARAIVDFKSGRKGAHYENVVQLVALRDQWNIEHPDLPVEILANLNFKDYRLPLGKSAPYDYKDHTKGHAKELKRAEKEWPLLVQAYHLSPIEIKDRTEFVEFAQIDLQTDLENLTTRQDVRGAVVETIKAQKAQGGDSEGENTKGEPGPAPAGDREDQDRQKGRKRRQRESDQPRLL